MESTARSESHGLDALAGALLGLACVLLLRRYGGIDHDAALYLGQALREQAPGIFGRDLFFLHGNQGSYTLFPRLLAASFNWSSPPEIFLWGTLAGMLCFAAAGWFCLRALLPEGQRYWAWLGVLCLPSAYGRTPMFSYGESFLTPRPFAEALCLLGIGLLARDRRMPALACAILAGMLHPLQAIAASLVVWPWLVLRDRRWLHALWLAIPIAALGFTGIKPFDDLFRSIDPEWLQDLRDMTRQVFVTRWPASDYMVLGFDVFVLACAWRAKRGPFGAWCLAALTGLGLGFATNLVMVDWLHLALPAQLQLWRVHWLAHWLAMAAFVILLSRDFAARDIPRALCLCLAGLLLWTTKEWTWLPFGLLHAFWPRFSMHVQPRIKLLLGGLFAAGMLLLLIQHIAVELLPFRLAHYRLELYAFDRRVLMFPLIALGLPLLGVHGWGRLAPSWKRPLIAGLLCPVVVLGAIRWDARPPIRLALEGNPFRPDLFGMMLPENAQVFWDDDPLVGTWLTLHRASFFNTKQLSGVAFNRGTARDGRSRMERIWPIVEESLHCQDRSLPLEEREQCRISDTALHRACAPGHTPKPDYLILPYRQRQRPSGNWSIIDPATGEPAVTYWLYACRDMQG